MVARAATGDKDVASIYNCITKCLYLVVLLIGGGLDTCALLKYFLDCIVCKLSLVGVSKLPCYLGDAPCHRVATEIENADAGLVNYRYVSVIKKYGLICIL